MNCFALACGVAALMIAQDVCARDASEVGTVAFVDQRDLGARDPRRDWLDKVEASRRRSASFIESARASSLILSDDAPRPLTIRRRRGLFDDPTLAPGDAVMTAQGLRLFAGVKGGRHSEADFEPLDEYRGSRGAHWLELISLQIAR